MNITIIGAGILGLSTAYYLQQYGHTITLVESLEKPAMETSFANAGLIAPSTSSPWNAPGVLWQVLKYLGNNDSPILFRLNALPSLGIWGLKFLRQSSLKYFERNLELNINLANYTSKLMKELVEKEHIAFDYESKGTLLVSRHYQSFQASIAHAKLMEKFHVPFKICTKNEVLEKEPSLESISSDLVGGIFFPEDACGDAHVFSQALAQRLSQQGVRFLYQTKAQLKAQNPTLAKLFIHHQEVSTDCIIIAAGIESASLAKEIGIQLPLRPCKGYSITFPSLEQNVPQIPIHDDSLHAVVTPLGKHIRVAGTAEFAGFNKNLTPGRIQNLFNILKVIYPQLAIDPSTVQPWAGLRPMCVDDVPIIGSTQYENVFVNTGHGHLGWTSGLGSGKLLADFISLGKTEFPLADYQLNRF